MAKVEIYFTSTSYWVEMVCGASFVNQSQRSKVKPKQSKVTFDTKLKTALIVIIVISVKMKAIFPVMNTA